MWKYFREPLKVYRCCVFGLFEASEEERDAGAQQSVEIQSLSELACPIDVIRTLFIKQITPGCLVLGLFLRHRLFTGVFFYIASGRLHV